MEENERTDYPYEPYGKLEDWTWEGKKVYNYSWKIDSQLNFVETFCTEDGQDLISITRREDWTPEMQQLAFDHYYL